MSAEIPSPSLSEAELYRLYVNHVVDLIRTAGKLAGISPTIIYHASVLLHHFERKVEAVFRSRYSKADHSDHTSEGEQGEEVGSIGQSQDPQRGSRRPLVPYQSIVNVCSNSGVMPLGDLFAPIEHCVRSMVDKDNDDVYYLAAACLFLSEKLVDSMMVSLKHLVEVFLRLSLARQNVAGDFVSTFIQLRGNEYRDAIVIAEEQMVNVLGFRMGFVETPYKYLLCYLQILIDDSDTTEHHHQLRATEDYLQWVREATAVLNDIPRLGPLLSYSPSQLAVYAMDLTCPSSATSAEGETEEGEAVPASRLLPIGWSRCFGVSETTLSAMKAVAEKEKSHWVPSAELMKKLKLALFPSSSSLSSTPIPGLLGLDGISGLPFLQPLTTASPSVASPPPPTVPLSSESLLTPSAMLTTSSASPLPPSSLPSGTAPAVDGGMRPYLYPQSASTTGTGSNPSSYLSPSVMAAAAAVVAAPLHIPIPTPVAPPVVDIPVPVAEKKVEVQKEVQKHDDDDDDDDGDLLSHLKKRSLGKEHHSRPPAAATSSTASTPSSSESAKQLGGGSGAAGATRKPAPSTTTAIKAATASSEERKRHRSRSTERTSRHERRQPRYPESSSSSYHRGSRERGREKDSGSSTSKQSSSRSRYDLNRKRNVDHR